MTNPNTPYGFLPLNRIDGTNWNDSARMYYIPASQTNALYVGDPVIKQAASADVNGVNAVDLATAGNSITGVIVGFVGACAAGAAKPALFAFSGSPGNISRPASTSLDYYALVVDDPEVLFAVQENDNYGGVSGTPLPVAAVGKNANFIHAAGNAYTGQSGTMLDTDTVATTSTLQFNIVGFLQEPDNVPGALYAKVLVRLNKSTEVNASAGI